MGLGDDPVREEYFRARFGPPKEASVIHVKPSEVTYLDAQLLQGDRLRLLPAAVYRQIPHAHLRLWASLHGRYGLPTQELIDWLKAQIGNRRALEIGAGCGDLGYHLGITMTDSYQQVDDPATAAHYAALRQVPTTPPPDVIKEDAENAVRKRKPQVVIGSWITEKWLPANVPWENTGNYKGPREEYILDRCATYILVGNQNIHGKKRILKLPHAEFSFPWLVSRAADQTANRIYVWCRPRENL